MTPCCTVERSIAAALVKHLPNRLEMLPQMVAETPVEAAESLVVILRGLAACATDIDRRMGVVEAKNICPPRGVVWIDA